MEKVQTLKFLTWTSPDKSGCSTRTKQDCHFERSRNLVRRFKISSRPVGIEKT